MWGAIISALVQVAVMLIKMWIEGRQDKDEAIAEISRLADEAMRTGDSRPLRAYIAKLRADRKAR